MACPARPVLDRLADKFTVGDGCWEWTASKTPLGYGKFGVGGKRGGWRSAHIVVYELMVGPVEEGLELDHLCRNPSCVRPGHLEPVSHAVNMRRALVKTHCVRGHELSDENTHRYSYGRVCRLCQKARQQEGAT